MKQLFVFIIFFNSFLYSQTRKATDSVAYYGTLSASNIKVDNYKNALFYTQKAINYSKANHNLQAQVSQTFTLGKIYYDLKKYNDATATLNKSISLFGILEPNSDIAKAYYYLSLSYLGKRNYAAAEIQLRRAQAINEKLNIADPAELLTLQKGILYKSQGDYDLASTIFKTIIAKSDTPITLDSKAEALYQIGLIEEKNNRNNLTLNYLEKALDLNAKNNNLEQKSNILLALSSVYDKMLDKSKAFSSLKQHLNLKESISILNNKKLGIDDYEKFKETVRSREIVQLQQQNKEKLKAAKFSKLISILAIALITILSLLSLSLYKNNIIRIKSNLLLKEKNNELIAAKEKAERASQARSDFLSTVSHELRTPLNAINGITHLLLEEKPKKSQLHYLNSLEFSGNYLATFINDILEINRIDSNKVEVENISFNFKKLLQNLQNSLIEQASLNDNRLQLEIDSEIPTNLIGDPTKLSQIFLNLINNGLKFTKNGTISVIAKLHSLENEKASIYFEVKDTGIGIAEDKLETVFESFSQGSVEINRKYGGTGLGLTIVKKLIKILGGKIKLESVLGKGTTFSFELQFKVAEETLATEEKAKTNDDYKLKNKKILLVEDNKINQMITKKMLTNKGIICEIIDNGEEAIERMKNNTYDLVLMDVHLSGINGTIATKQIREFDKTTPIIALTAISLNENRQTLLSYGMNDVVTKPFVPENLYSVMSQYV
jgi:signal transduction histidine kinase/CheY-like chemotaxis protein